MAHSAKLAAHLDTERIEAERALLGGLMIADDEFADLANLLASLTPELFHDARHRQIFRTIRALHADGSPIGPWDIHQRLVRDGGPGAVAAVGGDPILLALPDHCPSLANWEYWRRIVTEHHETSLSLQDLRRAVAEIESGDYDPSALHELLSTATGRFNGRSTSGDLPEPVPWASLTMPVDFADNLLGNRFLERGQGLFLVGPAGCGKSVGALQACVAWAGGLHGIHIKPQRPLKIVVLQTEDSLNDSRDSLKGILEPLSEADRKVVYQNLVILPPLPSGNTHALSRYLHAAMRTHHPDMVMLNPLLAFVPGDPGRELGGLLYQVIDPILKEHHCGLMAVHHTVKTHMKDTSGYGAFDHQYLAAGDARVANWPRAMVLIEPLPDGIFRFRLAKRATRAGWLWDQNPSVERYFRWASGSVRWIDASPDEISQAKRDENYKTILEILPPADKDGLSRDRLLEQAKKVLNVGKTKAERWIALAIEDGSAERYTIKTDNKRLKPLFRLKGPESTPQTPIETEPLLPV